MNFIPSRVPICTLSTSSLFLSRKLPVVIVLTMIYDETAQPVSTSFADYLLPSATELPSIELISHVSPSPLNPLGVKGVGECGVIPAAAAIISAIEHALDAFGVLITETPISPARILELLNSVSSAATAPIGRSA